MFPTTQNNITNLKTALQNSKVHETTNGSGKAFIRFDFSDGTFTYGREQEEITGDTIVINSYSFQHGWILWHNRQAEKVMRSFVEELPEALAPKGNDQPAEARAFEARFEDDPETILVFETNSYGGRSGVDSLIRAISLKSAQGEENFLFPVVELDSSSYESKQGRTIFNPIFKIVGWMNEAGEMEQAQQAIESQPEPEPEPEQEEAPAPKRRRRAKA